MARPKNSESQGFAATRRAHEALMGACRLPAVSWEQLSARDLVEQMLPRSFHVLHALLGAHGRPRQRVSHMAEHRQGLARHEGSLLGGRAGWSCRFAVHGGMRE